MVLWFWGILLNPRQIKGSKEMITSIYTKLFVLFYHLFFLLDNGSFQDSCTNNSCWIFFLSVIYQTLQIHYYVYIGFNVHEQLFVFLIQSQRQLPLNIQLYVIIYMIPYCVPTKIMLHLRTSLLPNNVIFFFRLLLILCIDLYMYMYNKWKEKNLE